MKSPVVVVISVIAGLLILAGASFWLARILAPPGSPAQETSPTEQPTPIEQPAPPAPTSEHPAVNLEQQAEELKTAIAEVCATGESKEVTLVITEAEANGMAAELFAQAAIPEDIPLEIKSIRIDFEVDNRVLIEIEIAAYGFEVTAKVRAEVSVENGQLRAQITDINFGFIPLPQSIKDKISTDIQQEIDRFLSQLTETDVGCDGKVVIEFKDVSVQQTEMTATIILRLST